MTPTVVITDRVFALAALATLMVALALAAGMGWLAFAAMERAAITRDAYDEAKARADQCRDALLKSDARLEQVRDLFEVAGGRKKPVEASGVGGVP